MFWVHFVNENGIRLVKSSCNILFLSFGVNKWALSAEEVLYKSFTEKTFEEHLTFQTYIWSLVPTGEKPQGHKLLISKLFLFF